MALHAPDKRLSFSVVYFSSELQQCRKRECETTPFSLVYSFQIENGRSRSLKYSSLHFTLSY